MAICFRTDAVGIILFAFENRPTDIATPCRPMIAVDGYQGYELDYAEANNFIAVRNNSFKIERLLIENAHKSISLVLRCEQTEVVLHAERLYPNASFFVPISDYLAAKRMPPFNLEDIAPARTLAVFTHAYNDHDILRLWQKHYLQLVPPQDLYVIDHGSTMNLGVHLHHGVNIIRIPRSEVDHGQISRFCGYFQRFLLETYAWVIHVDADELVAHRGGPKALMSRLAEDPTYGPIVRTGEAWELLDKSVLNADEQVVFQNNLAIGAKSPKYRKPILAKSPTTWTIGFHNALEPVTSDQDLILIHTRYADIEAAARREQRVWMNAPLSANDSIHVSQDRRTGVAEELRCRVRTEFCNQIEAFPDWAARSVGIAAREPAS